MKKLFYSLLLSLLVPVSVAGISVSWEKLVQGGIHPFGLDKVLIGATATSTNATLETIGESYFSSTSTFDGNVVGVSLSEIEDLTADKTFTLANKLLIFRYTNPAGGILYDLTGAGSGHFIEVNQNTGNPSANTHLMHLQATDNDVLPFHIVHPGSPALGYMQISSTSTTPASGNIFIVDSVGRVGIASSSPSSMLTIFATTTNPGLGVYASNSTPVIYTSLAGNVGIGTTGPAYTLDVNGQLRVVATTTLNSNLTGVLKATAGVVSTSSGAIVKSPMFNFTPATTSEALRRLYARVPTTSTIKEIGCYTSENTSTLAFFETSEATPNASSSSIVDSLICDADTATTTTFIDSSIADRGGIGAIVLNITNSTNTWAWVKYEVQP